MKFLYIIFSILIILSGCKTDEEKCKTFYSIGLETGRVVILDSSDYLDIKLIEIIDTIEIGQLWGNIKQHFCGTIFNDHYHTITTVIDLNKLDSGILYQFNDEEIFDKLKCYADLRFNNQNDNKKDNGTYRINSGEITLKKIGNDWTVMINISFEGVKTGTIYVVSDP